MNCKCTREFDEWSQRARDSKTKELQSKNDFMSIHGVPSEEVVNKPVIKMGSERRMRDCQKQTCHEAIQPLTE